MGAMKMAPGQTTITQIIGFYDANSLQEDDSHWAATLDGIEEAVSAGTEAPAADC
jgi:hypothetical protein